MGHWLTAYGAKIDFNKLSHQHLSNIVYYNRLVLEMEPPDVIGLELTKRFGGIILPYHPLISFTFEMKALVEKGYTSGEPDADIIVNGIWVGTVKYS